MPRATFIRDENQLLDALRENPTRRAVVLRFHSRRKGDLRALVEFSTGDPRGDGRLLAWIMPGSVANLLLNFARLADEAAAADAWASLPLRHGPYDQTFVLPDHPLAPTDARVPPQGHDTAGPVSGLTAG